MPILINHHQFQVGVSCLCCIMSLCADGPNLEEGNNVTNWVEYRTGDSVTLTCTMNGSNPSNYTLDYSTSSLSSDLVVNATTKSIKMSFTNASSNNSGFYNCTASTDIATTTLSYWVFIGGKWINTVSTYILRV